MSSDRTVGTVKIRVLPDFSDFDNLLKQGLGKNMTQAEAKLQNAVSAYGAATQAFRPWRNDHGGISSATANFAAAQARLTGGEYAQMQTRERFAKILPHPVSTNLETAALLQRDRINERYRRLASATTERLTRQEERNESRFVSSVDRAALTKQKMDERRVASYRNEFHSTREKLARESNAEVAGDYRRQFRDTTRGLKLEEQRDNKQFSQFLADEKEREKAAKQANKSIADDYRRQLKDATRSLSLEEKRDREQARKDDKIRRQGVRLSNAEFSAELAGMSPSQQVSAIRQRQQTYSPNSLEHLQLERQARSLGPKTGLNREVMGMGQYMNVLFGGWEVASSANSFISANREAGMTNDPRKQYDVWNKAIDRQQGGILGSMVGGAANGLDAIVAKGSIWERRYSRASASQIVSEADKQDAATALKLEAMDRIKAADRSTYVESGGLSMRRQREAETTRTAAIEKAEIARNEVIAADRSAKAIATKAYASDVAAANAAYGSAMRGIEGDRVLGVRKLDSQRLDFLESADGLTYEGQRRSTKRRHNDRIAEMRIKGVDSAIINEQFKTDEAELFAMQSQNQVQEGQFATRANSQLKSMGLQYDRRFLEAKKAEIDGELKAYLMNPALTKNERDAAKYMAQGQRGLIDQQFKDRDKLANIGLNSERDQLNYALDARRNGLTVNPYVAQAHALAGQGAMAYEQYQQQGMWGQAEKSMQNTRMGLELTQQDYVNGFRAQQVNLNTTTFSEGRGVANPGETLSKIEQLLSKLPERFKELIAN